jgi:hypothetical protein
MRLFTYPKMNEAGDGQGGSGGNAGGEPQGAAAGATGATGEKGAEQEGDQFDDLGYPIESKGDQNSQAKSGDQKPADAEKPPEPATEPVTGYGAEPVKAEEPPPASAPQSVEPTKLDFELKLDGLTPEQAELVRKDVKKYGLNAEAAQKFADDNKAAIEKAAVDEAAAKQKIEADTKRVKTEWYNQLKNDPNFGGEKFAFNVSQAEKVVEKFMPEVKKSLTDRKGMLPPDVMRGLARIGEALFGAGTLKQGDPVVPKSDTKSDDPYAFLADMYPNGGN